MSNRDIYSFEVNNSNSFSNRELFESFLHNWYWFVFSLFICLLIAFLYANSRPERYRAEAMIMIKDDQNGRQMSEASIFSDMGIMGRGAMVENEMYVLRSSGLMSTVVERLNLDVTYMEREYLRTVDIYNKSPISIVFDKKEDIQGLSLLVEPLSKLKFKYAVQDGLEENTWKEASFDSQISVPNGKLTVKSTNSFDDSSIGKTIEVHVSNVKSTAKSLLSGLTVNRMDKITGTLRLSLICANSNKAKDVLNMLIKTYNEDVVNDKNRIALSTEMFIIDRIAKISGELGNVDGQIEQLKRESQTIDITTSTDLAMQAGTKYKDEIVSISTELAIARYVKNYLKDPSKKDNLIPVNIGLSDVRVESQINKYNEERLRLDKMLANSGENNPVMLELVNTLEATKGTIIQSIDNLIESLKIKESNASYQESMVSRRIFAAPAQEKKVTDVLRQQKIKEELYLYLLNKREENALNLAITGSNAKIVENADGSKKPIAPILENYLVIALLIGLFFPIVIIFIVRLLDNKVHNKLQIEQTISIPVIGELPCKKNHQRSSEIMVSETGRDRISEAFRIIRGNIDFVLDKQTDGAKIIQLTSTLPGEGKTYVTINLALSYAHTGKRVLIMDLDLRKGQMTKVLDVNNRVGVSSILSGNIVDIKSVINRGIIHKNLDFISTGPIPPNPVNLLLSDHYERMIRELEKEYDYIFIDSVPAMIIADASIINRVVDITLYIMRGGMIDKRYLYELEKIYKESKFRNMSIIVSDVDVDKKSSGYANTYGYGYIED